MASTASASPAKAVANAAFHTTPAEFPVVALEVQKAFASLSPKEQMYAHWISQASWWGFFIVLEQVSPEAPQIFSLFQRLFTAQPIADLKKAAQQGGVTEDEFTRFLGYASCFYGNAGNYQSFGDSKFIPNLSQAAFMGVVKACSLQGAARKTLVSDAEAVLPRVYSLGPKDRFLGYPEEGTSTYYSPDISKAEIEEVGAFMVEHSISPYNTRLFKRGPSSLELRLASADATQPVKHTLKSGKELTITRGDYAAVMVRIVQCLKEAAKYAANPTQEAMLQKYISHFQHGDINDHMDAQRLWVKDIAPAVESNIGFIESYRDPNGARGEFEGFVAIVDKHKSQCLAALAEHASQFIAKLPWPKAFEKDVFRRPDFTSLEVITFSSSGIPSGINIPNYDVIRQNEGFKNVSLGNVISAVQPERVTFIADQDQDIFQKLRVPAFEVQVGIHELLGHGSGKLLTEEGGKKNFDPATVNPLTNKPVTSWYKQGETYDSKFGALGSAFEECRAESVGIFLSAVPELLKVFGHEGQAASDITYANWLSMARAGVCALEFYNPEIGDPSKRWGQAHMYARFIILRVLLAAKEGFVTIDIDQKNGDATVKLDRQKIATVGCKAMADFLFKMQVLKATADIQGAQELFRSLQGDMSEFLPLREIVIKQRKPRRVFVQVHTQIVNNQVVVKDFPASYEGMVQSFVTRFGVKKP